MGLAAIIIIGIILYIGTNTIGKRNYEQVKQRSDNMLFQQNMNLPTTIQKFNYKISLYEIRDGSMKEQKSRIPSEFHLKGNVGNDQIFIGYRDALTNDIISYGICKRIRRLERQENYVYSNNKMLFTIAVNSAYSNNIKGLTIQPDPNRASFIIYTQE
jgi:hypothetical protein